MSVDLFSDPTLQRHPEQLLAAVAKQVATNLRAVSDDAGALRVLANYFTKAQPTQRGLPFCVALAECTMQFHMQLTRPLLNDVSLWAVLFRLVASMLRGHERHPFFTVIMRRMVLGMGTAPGDATPLDVPAHGIVLLPQANFAAYAHLAVSLAHDGALPHDLGNEWADVLMSRYAVAASPLVRLRAEQLLVRCTTLITHEENTEQLMQAVMNTSTSVPLEFLRLLYFRLEAAAPDIKTGPMQVRALSIMTARVFLAYSSPVRRAFVETKLYPSLCSPDMAPMLAEPVARFELMGRLLPLVSTTASASCPFYNCLKALLHPALADAVDGARLFLTMMQCQMPHGAHFVSAMALDRNVDAERYANMVVKLSYGLALALSNHPQAAEDPVAALIGSDSCLAYKALFTMRCIVRKVWTTPTNSRVAMLQTGLRSALPETAVSALGNFCDQAFSEAAKHDADPVFPSLLVAEMGMVMHGTNINSALDSLHDHFGDAMDTCRYCQSTKASTTHCLINGTEHLPNRNAKDRVLCVIAAECVMHDAVVRHLENCLRTAPLSLATHRTVFEILRRCGAHRGFILAQLDSSLVSTMGSLSARLHAHDRNTATAPLCSGITFMARTLSFAKGAVSSEAVSKFQKLVRTLMSVFPQGSVLDPRDQALHHVALTVWWACGWLLRNTPPALLQLKPTANTAESTIPVANALAVLNAMHNVHTVSVCMNRLVGLAATRLMIDFNMQSMNIAEHLLTPWGLQDASRSAARHFALPSEPSSTFWTFSRNQLRRSAPFRASFVATMAKSTAMRFRSDNPAAMLQGRPGEAEPKAPLLFTMSVGAMRQDASLCNAVVAALRSCVEDKPQGRAMTKALNVETPGQFVLMSHLLQQTVAALRSPSATNGFPLSPGVHAICGSTEPVLRQQIPKLHELLATLPTTDDGFGQVASRVTHACRRSAGDTTAPSTYAELSSIPYQPDSGFTDAQSQQTASRDASEFGGDYGAEPDYGDDYSSHGDQAVLESASTSGSTVGGIPPRAPPALGADGPSTMHGNDSSHVLLVPPLDNSSAAGNWQHTMHAVDNTDPALAVQASRPAAPLPGVPSQQFRDPTTIDYSVVPQPAHDDEPEPDFDAEAVWNELYRQSTRSVMRELEEMATQAAEEAAAPFSPTQPRRHADTDAHATDRYHGGVSRTSAFRGQGRQTSAMEVRQMLGTMSVNAPIEDKRRAMGPGGNSLPRDAASHSTRRGMGPGGMSRSQAGSATPYHGARSHGASPGMPAVGGFASAFVHAAKQARSAGAEAGGASTIREVQELLDSSLVFHNAPAASPQYCRNEPQHSLEFF